MKILLINNYATRGGAETVFRNTAKLLKEKGNSVITLTQNSSSFDLDSQQYSIPHNKFFFNRFYSLDSKKIVAEILDKEKPDIVNIHNIIGGLTFSILPEIKKRRIPLVATVHDFRMLCPVGIFLNRKGEVCEKCKVGNYFQCIVNNCHPQSYYKSLIVATESYLRDFFIPHQKYIGTYIFVSNFTRNKFLEYYPEIEKSSEVLYNFVEDFSNEFFRGDYFLYFGRLDREKGLNLLIDVFKELPEFNLKILGRGEMESEIININNPNIEYLGFKTGKELKDFIKNSSFVIVPSTCYETLSQSTLEAFSQSKPVIGSDLGGIKELIQSNVNGFLFKANRKDELMSTIVNTKNISENEYKKLCSNAFKFAKNNFNRNNFYDRLMAIYLNTIEKVK